MNADSDYIRVIFGLKLRQQRQKKNWSLQDLANQTGLSKSYLNEIENGKKYPKHDKIIQVAETLGCSFDDLVSTKLDRSLAPINEILQSDVFKEIPLDLFGINRNNLIGMISEAPKKVTAFINTLIEISQNYNLGKERFFFAVLRSFQELYNNHFPEIEEKAEAFYQQYNLKPRELKSSDLENILIEDFGYQISSQDFSEFGTLQHLRSLFIPEKKNLLLNKRLDENQKTFILAKEIGFQVLDLKSRPNTYSWVDIHSFEEILNNYYASYFAGGLLIPKKELVQKTADFFDHKEWKASHFEDLIQHFTNSPETLYYRLTNILASEFGIKDLFYLCFVKKKNTHKVQILKELHLNQQQAPRSNAMNEHYCRRWVSVRNLEQLETEDAQMTDAQISHYKDFGLSYLVISTSQKNPFSDGSNRSYCLGILLNSNSLKKINFSKSDALPIVEVGVTCEHCSIGNCDVRQAPATRLDKEHFNNDMKKSIEKIRSQFLKSS